MAIELVLATDMKRHHDIIAKWSELVSRRGFSHGRLSADEKHGKSDRLILMQMIIKLSDIANPAKSFKTHEKWSELVTEEFYNQGDEERYRVYLTP